VNAVMDNFNTNMREVTKTSQLKKDKLYQWFKHVSLSNKYPWFLVLTA